MTNHSIVEQILDLARWAPSGDNSQPWRFEILSDQHVRVHAWDQADTDVYDYNGQPSMLTLGFFLESMRIAASHFGRRMEWNYQRDTGHEHLLDVRLPSNEAKIEDTLFPYLTTRSVDRRCYLATPLTSDQKSALEIALGSEFEIRWFESFSERWRIAQICALSTDIRLNIPEAFAIHEKILDWDNDFSQEGVPVKAIGLDPMTLKSMKWVMQKWSRVQFFNRFAAGTMVPRLEMDILPGLFCGAHFMVFRKPPRDDEEKATSLLRAGQALQRFWLKTTGLGMALQPALAPLCFAYYGRNNLPFTSAISMRQQAKKLASKLNTICSGQNTNDLLFMGRMGLPVSLGARPRSIRRPLVSLIIPSK